MKIMKKVFPVMVASLIVAGLFGGSLVSANESEKETSIQQEDAAPQYVPVGDEGHTWKYIKTNYSATGYSKVYSDSDAYYYYSKEVFYDNNGNYIKTVYNKYPI